MEEEKLKTLLTVLAILLMGTLLGLIIYNVWSKPQTTIPSLYIQSPEKDKVEATNNLKVNVDTETLSKAEELYNQSINIWYGVSSKDADLLFVTDNNGGYINIEHDYVSKNSEGKNEIIKGYIFYQFKDNIITDNFSKTGIQNLIKSSDQIIFLNNHYYYADTWKPNYEVQNTLTAIKQTTNEITFEVTNNTDDKVSNFIIEKENNTWKIKKFEINV